MKGSESLDRISKGYIDTDDISTLRKELKALEILIKWYQPYVIHDLCCYGATDEEINLVREVLKG